MRSSTITLALSLLAAAVSVSGTYTNGNDFFDDLPTCIKDCNADAIAAVKKQCDSASNNLECVCTASDSMSASSSDAACTLSCSEDDQDDLIKVSLEMATSCVPYLAGENSSNNSTSSTMSSMSGMTTATGSSAVASSMGGSSSSGSMTTTTSSTNSSTTGTGTATETPSSTASNSPAQAGAAAGRAAWAGSLLVAVPAALLAGMLV